MCYCQRLLDQPHPGVLIRHHTAGFIPQSQDCGQLSAPQPPQREQLLLGQGSARAGSEILAATAVGMTTKKVILKKLQAGFEQCNPAGDDTPSHDRLTTCWGFGMPQSSWLVSWRQAMVPLGHIHRRKAFLKQEAIALLKKKSKNEKKENQKSLLMDFSITSCREMRTKAVHTSTP